MITTAPANSTVPLRATRPSCRPANANSPSPSAVSPISSSPATSTNGDQSWAAAWRAYPGQTASTAPAPTVPASASSQVSHLGPADAGPASSAGPASAEPRVGHIRPASRSRARWMRSSVCSRPSTSSDSNSGRPTVRPVTATRTGACVLPSDIP